MRSPIARTFCTITIACGLAISHTAMGLRQERVLTINLVVSASGSDSAQGTRAHPFRTITRAQAAVRALSVIARRAPVTVWLRSGVYYLQKPILFTPADSGTRRAPISYRSWPGERVVLSGGTPLHLRWRPYKGLVLQATVPKDLVADELFVNDQLQQMARYPNYDPAMTILNGYAADALSPAHTAKWVNPVGGYIHAMQQYMWGDQHYRITGRDSAGRLTWVGGFQNNRPTGMHPQYRYVENIFEELDAPGEWYLDGTGHTLYFYPRANLRTQQATVVAVGLRTLVRFVGTPTTPVHNIALRGIVFQHAARTFMEPYEPLLRSDWSIARVGAIIYSGAVDCTLDSCTLDRVGGNGVFVSGYNRRIVVHHCFFNNIGASGVAFAGLASCVRNPLFNAGTTQSVKAIALIPGPRAPDYPADCIVDDCLVLRSGREEKQSAGVEIAMSRRIIVRHCTICGVPRAGINIGDGCWGGNVIEFCDIFDTVLETGDHGSFNSWGRDRYWQLKDTDLNHSAVVAGVDLPRLDTVQPNILRNNRWRCDHGWDIDLDDGSTNYIIENNLCLNGGIKLREGFYRRCSNNIMVNNSLHAHVWFTDSGDTIEHNIVFTPYRPIGMPTAWGVKVDGNLLHVPGGAVEPADALQKLSRSDGTSLRGDAMFADPVHGGYRVKPGSPALKLGFENFPMDRFGVTSGWLRAQLRITN